MRRINGMLIKIKRISLIISAVLWCLFMAGMISVTVYGRESMYGERYGERETYGGDYETDYDEELSRYNLGVIDKVLDGEDMDFSGTVKKLLTGQSEGVFYELFKGVTDKLFGDVKYNREVIVKIIVIAVISSLFTNMSIILKKTDMSETGFYVTYMLTVTILMGGFAAMTNVVAETAERIVEFMNVLIPAFLMAVGTAGGGMTAAGFSGILLLAIGIIEKIIRTFLIPAVNVYVVIMLVNNIVEEDYFSKMGGVIKTGVMWSLKGMTGILLGANVIQSIILPSADGAKKGVINKIINILPGGDAITGIEGIIATTGNVIKNAIGGAGLVAICVICVFPLVKMLIYIGMYKLTGAVVQPISDKRLGDSIDAVSEGIGLLYKIIFTLALLMFLTVAIVCISTNMA